MTPLTECAEIRTDLFMDGEIHGADNALKVVAPADTASVVGYAAAADVKQAEAAVAAAHRTFPGWAARTPQDRAALLPTALAPLEADRPAPAEVLTRENGKIRMESFHDSLGLETRFAWRSAWPTRSSTSRTCRRRRTARRSRTSRSAG